MEINLSLYELSQVVFARFGSISTDLSQRALGLVSDDDIDQGIKNFEEVWEMYKQKVLEEIKEKS